MLCCYFDTFLRRTPTMFLRFNIDHRNMLSNSNKSMSFNSAETIIEKVPIPKKKPTSMRNWSRNPASSRTVSIGPSRHGEGFAMLSFVTLIRKRNIPHLQQAKKKKNAHSEAISRPVWFNLKLVKLESELHSRRRVTTQPAQRNSQPTRHGQHSVPSIVIVDVLSTVGIVAHMHRGVPDWDRLILKSIYQ